MHIEPVDLKMVRRIAAEDVRTDSSMADINYEDIKSELSEVPEGPDAGPEGVDEADLKRTRARQRKLAKTRSRGASLGKIKPSLAPCEYYQKLAQAKKAANQEENSAERFLARIKTEAAHKMLKVLDEEELEALNLAQNPFQNQQEKYRIHKLMKDSKDATFIDSMCVLRALKKKQRYLEFVKGRNAKLDGGRGALSAVERKVLDVSLAAAERETQ